MKKIGLIWLAAGAFLSSVGMSFIWPLTSVYLHNDLGISLTMIGIVLFFNSLASVIGSYVGGALFDRFNPAQLIRYGILGALLSFILLAFLHGWPAFGILLFLNGLSAGWNSTLVYAMGTNVDSKDSRRVFTILYFVQNMGVVIGTSLVGFVYDAGITYLFMIAIFLYLIFLLIAWTKYSSTGANATKTLNSDEKNKGKAVVPKPNLIVLFTLFISLMIIWTMYQQWDSNLSVYMTDLGIPLSQYSLLWTLNAFLIMVMQVIIIWLSRYYENYIVQIIFGLIFVTISFVTLVFAHDYGYFVVAMILLTIGEATAIPTIPALVNNLAPLGTKGRYQGLVNSWSSAGRAIGPLIGGIIIEKQSYTFLFEIATLALAIVVILVVISWLLNRKKITMY